jgi:hypothetical protein
MGSFRPSLSIAAWTKLAPMSPVRTTTAAVSEEFTPEPQEKPRTCWSAIYGKDKWNEYSTLSEDLSQTTTIFSKIKLQI